MTDDGKTPLDDDGLERFFDAARRDAPDPSDALMARVLADALAAQPPAAPRPLPRPGVWASLRAALTQLRAALGGWPALGGLATAGLMGLAIGIAAPASMADLATALLGQGADTYLVDLMPELDFDIAMDLSEG